MALIALVLAAGREITARIPQGKQIDWEAILRHSPKDFMDEVVPWFNGGVLDRDVLDGLVPVEEVLDTPRKITAALNKFAEQ